MSVKARREEREVVERNNKDKRGQKEGCSEVPFRHALHYVNVLATVRPRKTTTASVCLRMEVKQDQI